MKAFLRSAAALVFGASLAMSAHAVDTWTYTSVSNNAGVDTASSGAASLTTIGAFATNNGTNGVTGNRSTNTVGTPSAALQFYSGGGLGMGSDGTGTPNHAIDNNGTYTEGVLLNFSTSTILTGVDLGYISGDADISVFRFVGNSAPTLNSTGASLSAMNSAGWQLVGNYANLTADNTAPINYNLVNGASNSLAPTAGSGSVGSSWWLITAYNTAYGTGTNLTQGDDYFKLLAVAGTACTGTATKCGTVDIPKGVPEPATLALTSVALVGVAGLRRRKAKLAA
jgi:hypothetical protein